MTGPTAELGLRMRDGVLLGLERANLEGGVQGRRLALRAYDDGYEPYRVAPNIQRLIDVDHALAIIGNVGTPTAVAALPLIKKPGCAICGSVFRCQVVAKNAAGTLCD